MNAPLAVADWIALGFFFIAWIFYEPLLKKVGRPGGLINTDMTVIRMAWMRNMVRRDVRLMDGQLVGLVLNSASFFASSNLILIAAAAGALFNGDQSFKSATAVSVIQTSTPALFEFQVALVVIPLARGLLAFIWSIRQLNYCLAAIGGAPIAPSATSDGYAEAVARLLNPALSSFNAGVRGYYFAMAAAAWLFGPWAFLIATTGAVALLYGRQKLSPTAAAIASLRQIIETTPVQPASAPTNHADEGPVQSL